MLVSFRFPYYLTHAEFRYRLVIDPLMTMLAAYAVCEICRMMAKQEIED